jgi:hypothetical protein
MFRPRPRPRQLCTFAVHQDAPSLPELLTAASANVVQSFCVYQKPRKHSSDLELFEGFGLLRVLADWGPVVWFEVVSA